jgi:hypothetical protein
MAFFRAIAWVPKARARVTTKGRASGTPGNAIEILSNGLKKLQENPKKILVDLNHGW